MASLHDNLKRIGFKEKEISIYLSCLGNKEQTAQQIADKTNLSRQVIYDNIKTLLQKGIIICIQKDSALHYKANEPKSLLVPLEEQEEIVREILPELEQLHKTESSISIAQVHKGSTAIRFLLKEALTSTADLYFFTNRLEAEKLFLEHEFYNLTQKRIESKTKLSIIMDTNPLSDDEKSIWCSDISQLRTSRTHPLANTIKTTTIIYENKVIFINMHQVTPHATRIEDEYIASTQKVQFLNLWEQGEKI